MRLEWRSLEKWKAIGISKMCPDACDTRKRVGPFGHYEQTPGQPLGSRMAVETGPCEGQSTFTGGSMLDLGFAQSLVSLHHRRAGYTVLWPSTGEATRGEARNNHWPGKHLCSKPTPCLRLPREESIGESLPRSECCTFFSMYIIQTCRL